MWVIQSLVYECVVYANHRHCGNHPTLSNRCLQRDLFEGEHGWHDGWPIVRNTCDKWYCIQQLEVDELQDTHLKSALIMKVRLSVGDGSTYKCSKM